MVIRRFLAFASLAIAAIVGFPSAFVAAVDRGIDRALDFIASLGWASLPRLVIDGPTLELESPGVPFDPALQHSLRHEANHDHRAAARNI